MPVILISQGTMSGGHTLVDCLKERTGIRCISHEDLHAIVDRHGELATRVVEKLDHATSAYDQFSEMRWPYMVLMRKAMLEEICADNMVYHGYSAHLLLPIIRHFVRVRIEAPMNMRLTMTMKRLNFDENAARDYIGEVDQHRVKWARFMYGKDIRNTLLYDVNLNIGHMTIEAACGMLESILREKDFQISPESREAVDRLHLAADIEVALVTNPRTAAFEITAQVGDDGVRLIGPYLENSELEKVLEVARTVPHADQLQYTPGYAHQFQTGV